MARDRSCEFRVVWNGATAIDGRRADDDDIARYRRRPRPQRAPGVGIERGHRARRLGDVHDPIDHDGGGFEDSGTPDLIHPGWSELAYVLTVDLRQIGVALRIVIAARGQPILRVAG